ncbi:phospholipase D family protein [Thiofilum flexile]|uniref:phospholipase D family protein n=1 Tax=Thiofilum flexile TaxID=125627 RepID=UPI0003637B3A|nr:phospholipase D family protein [Thiofilum flexile]
MGAFFKRHFIISFLLLALIGLFVIRLLGDYAYPVEPEPSPEISVNTTTPLYQATQAALQQKGQGQPNLLYPLSNGSIALLNRIRLIDVAKDTIDIQYYLFHDDDAGRALLQASMEAAQRGVKVRLLLDDMDMKGRDAIFARIRQDQPNLQIRIFNPFWLRSFRVPEYLARFPQVTRRMHNKSFTVDQVTTIVGGRNVGNEYFNYNSDVAFNDFDMLVSGAGGQEVTQEFNTYWYSGLAYPIEKLGTPANDSVFQYWQQPAQQALKTYREEVAKQKDAIQTLLTNSNQTTYYAPISVLSDRPTKVISPLTAIAGNITHDIIKLMQSAKHELIISSPYFIPGEHGLQLFQTLRDAGVNITILTNSYAANDVAAVHAGYSNYRTQLLRMGVKIYELKPQSYQAEGFSLLGSTRASLHAKAFVVDRKTVFVGSFNLDPRSAIHNTEMGIVFENSQYGTNSVKSSEHYMQTQAYQVVLNDQGELEWQETSGSQTKIYTSEPNVSLLERMLITVISWLPVEWLM